MSNFFQERRKNKGLTQRQIADAFGIKAAAVSSWERGLSIPRPQFWQTLGKMLGVTIDQIAKAVSHRNITTPPGRSGNSGVSSPPVPASHDAAPALKPSGSCPQS